MTSSDSTSAEILRQLQQAVAHHQAGRIAEALKLYDAVVARAPEHVDALHFSALAANALGRGADALAYMQRAVAIHPDDPSLRNNFGELLRANGRTAEAMESYRKALSLKPDLAAAHNNLGSVLRATGQLDASIEHFRRALQVEPDYPEAHCNLGEALTGRGDYVGARQLLERSVALAPRMPQAWNNLGNLLKMTDLPRAIECYQKAIAVAPGFMPAFNNLGTALHDSDRLTDAVRALRKALELAPNSGDVHSNLCLVLGDQGLADDAVEHGKRAVTAAPNSPGFHNNLARAWVMRGEFEPAVNAYRHALRLQPDLADVHSNLLLTLCYRPIPPEQMLDEHVAWARAHAPRRHSGASKVTRDPERRLRIGYVSPDFRDHAVAHFIEPVLESHDREIGDVFCYSDVLTEDDVTRRLRSFGHHWRSIAHQSDDAGSRAIGEDQIDILIDLSGHTANNRLKLFARKPAPVQVTWIGYPNTTGLSSIDYWITDRHLDPPGQTEPYCTERLLRLPDTFTCYAPPRDAPDVGELPANRNGHITFASFNNLIKLGDDVVALWARLLQDLPEARLLVATRRLQQGQGLEPFREQCRRNQLPLDRVRFLPGQLPAEYLRAHNDVDIMLDCFPFTGHTITLNALWMGVPVVTLAGGTHVSRRGVSVMNNLGLPELIAGTPDDYVRIAIDLARDLARLAALRAGLRDRMRASPLMDAPKFAANLSNALRAIWQEYCLR